MLRIAIQGEKGCFHDAAAHALFKGGADITTIPCDTFPHMFETVVPDPSMMALMAIENTIAGPLLQNHELLRESGLHVVAEIKQRISHVLCALPGQAIDDIVEVNSHPMALMQCERFLHEHPRMKAVEKDDTAGAAAEIAERQLTGHAAICSGYAAGLYGLEILAHAIETDPHNYTRFLLLSHARHRPGGFPPVDKAMLEFTLPHTTGALSKVLAILSFYDINLTKIQSTPIIGREWEYRFYIDLCFESEERYHQAIEAIRPLANGLSVLGEFSDWASSTDQSAL